ncbi:MAG: alpha/beta hydrolase [Gammaproteobacteria bacterium]|nr:alpha/beta hydrolase [Gammaproteobacteria bacterium]
MDSTNPADSTPCPRLHKLRVNDTELAWFERNRPRANRPTLLFVHATGYHGRVWDRIAEAFPDLHVLALEQRGHGRSEKRRIDNWQVFGADLAGFVAALGLERVIGIGHSVGGHALVDAAAKSEAFARLILLDPTILEPRAYRSPEPLEFADGVHPVARRKQHFASAEEMAQRLLQKGAYHLFEPRILRDYCEHGLERLADGGYRLLCPPEVEASVYMNARSNGGVHDSVGRIRQPVLILRARLPPPVRAPMDFSSSPTWPALVHRFAHGREIHLADCSHLIPMQMPDKVIAAIREAVECWPHDTR